MRKFLFYTFVFICTLYILHCTFCIPVHAQVLTLDPASATKKVGEEFTVALNIDTEGQDAAGADAKMTFDSAILELVKVENGDFFSDFASHIGPGTLYATGFFKEQFGKKNGTGKMATLTLKGKNTGTTQLNFSCSTQTNDTNILSLAAADIARCAGVKGGSYVFAASDGGSPTATPTPLSSFSPTPTPPESGLILPTGLTLGAGLLLTVLGLVIIF